MRTYAAVMCLALLSGVVHAQALPMATEFSAELVWQAPENSPDPVAGYNVYRSLSASGGFALLESQGLGTTYADTSQLEYSTTYYYMVESIDASGLESPPSNVAGVPIPFVPYTPAVGKIISI